MGGKKQVHLLFIGQLIWTTIKHLNYSVVEIYNK